jgi:hypothetical protein
MKRFSSGKKDFESNEDQSVMDVGRDAKSFVSLDKKSKSIAVSENTL